MLPLILTLLLIQYFNSGYIILALFILPTFLTYLFWFRPKSTKKVEIPEIIRVPANAKRLEDVDYSMELDHIYWNIFNVNINGFLSPYEIVLVQITNQSLVSEQELAHAKIGTCCNKQFEKDYGFPAYSKVQLGWKKFTNLCRKHCPRVNYVVLATLESCFIFLVDFWAQYPSLFKRYINHWVLAYHLMEECEHGHLTVDELNGTFNNFEALWGFLFTLALVLFISLILVPIQCIFYFPKRALSPRGLFQAAEYFVTVMVVNLYMTYGGMIFFLMRGDLCPGEIMKTYRSFEKKVYNPYCIETGLIQHKVPKFRIKEIEERRQPRKRCFSEDLTIHE